MKLVLDEPSFELVAVNDLGDADNLAYLLRFDTVYGRYAKSVLVEGAEPHRAFTVPSSGTDDCRDCDPAGAGQADRLVVLSNSVNQPRTGGDKIRRP